MVDKVEVMIDDKKRPFIYAESAEDGKPRYAKVYLTQSMAKELVRSLVNYI